MTSKTLATICHAIGLMPMYIGGALYSTRSEYMPYHAIATGRSWDSLEPGLQTLYLATINGAGNLILSLAFALTLILAIPFQQGQRWSFWALPLIGVSAMVGGMLPAISVDLNTPADPPWQVFLVVITFFILGLFLSLKSTKKSN